MKLLPFLDEMNEIAPIQNTASKILRTGNWKLEFYWKNYSEFSFQKFARLILNVHLEELLAFLQLQWVAARKPP